MWTKGHELKYWNKNGIKKGTHIYDNYRQCFNLDDYDFKGKLLADIGCGPFGGIFYNRKDIDVVPIDILAKEYNQMNHSSHYIFEGDLNGRLPFNDNSFDYILCTNAIDHINDVQHGFDEVFRVLKEGGISFIHVHLRAKKELNKAHIHILDENKLERCVSKFIVIQMNRDIDWVNDRKDREAMYIILKKLKEQ